MRYIVRADDADRDSPIGGKARALAVLQRAGLPVPAWFALTCDAFCDSVPVTTSLLTI